ncbi:MAG: hypothetical protein R3F33_13165 [Planctomycetota bacterium]
MLQKKLTLLPGLVLALGGAAFAQGDSCSTATTITGTGSWAFDTSVLSTSGFDGGGSCGFGADTINQDGFYQWTVPASGDYQFDTYGSSFDTKLSVHTGVGCAATCSGYNDDTGGLQSEVQLIGLVAGQQMLVQIGGYGTSFGTGTLNISVYVDPCSGVPDDSFEDNDDCTTQTTLTVGAYTGLHTVMGDDDYYSVTIPAGMILTWAETFDSNDNTYDVSDATCSVTYLFDQLNGFDYANTTGAPETITVRAYTYPFALQNCTDYDIDLSIAPDPCATVSDDSFEDNDDCLTQTTLTVGTYTGLHTVMGDDDYYSVTIPAGMILTWAETFDSNDNTYDVSDATCSVTYLFDQLNGFDYANSTGAPETITVRAYTYPFANANCTDYDIDLSINPDPCASAPDDSFEDNDDCTTQTTLVAGAYTGLHTVMGDDDYYSVTIPAGMILTWGETFDSNDNTYDVSDATCSVTYLFDQLFGFTYANTTGAPETITVRAYTYPFANANCTDYDIDLSFAPDPCQQGSDDTLEENDDCSTATALSDGTYTNLFVSKADPDHYAVCIPDGATISLDVLFTHALGDVDAFLWDSTDPNCGGGINGGTYLALGFSASDNELLSWTNTTGAAVNAVLEVNVYAFSASDCNTYDLAITGSGNCGGPSFPTFCDPMNPNSTGQPTVMSASFGTGVGSDLHLEATQGPPTQFGYFLVGTGFSEPGLTISNGRLCLAVGAGSQIGRYNVAGVLNSVGQFNASGVLMNFVGTSTVGSGYDVPSNLPLTGNPTIASGDTWYFQLWHREAAGQSNFSNGIIVTFP